MSRAGQGPALPGHGPRGRSTLIGVGLVLAATVLFGSTPALVVRLRGELTWPELLAYRGLVAVPMLLMLMWLARVRSVGRAPARTPAESAPWILRYAGILVGVVLYAPQLFVFYKSFDYIDTSLAVAISYLYPTLVIILAAARRRVRPSGAEIALSLVAISGIAALTRTDDRSASVATGVLLVLAAALLYAIYAVVAGELVAHLSPLQIAVQVSGSVAVTVAVGGLVTGTLGLPGDGRTWLFILLQAVLQVASVSLYYLGLERLGASRTSLLDTAQPLFAVLAGSVLLGERLGGIQFVGIALVVSSVVTTAILSLRRPVKPLTEQT